MKRSHVGRVGLLAGVALLGGCAGSNLVGTWKGAGAADDAFSVASVTFRGNGTYSADVTEHGREMADSGSWSRSGKKLELSGHAQRHYEVRIRGDELTMTDPTTGSSATLHRSGG
jgi:hypothetical protein